MAPQLAWIGLGNMGKGMVKNIVEKGPLTSPILLYNRTVQRAEELSSSLPKGKSTAASSIKDVVQPSDIIFICVGDDAAVQETIKTALESDVSGKLFVDCSTIHPDTTASISESLTKAGATFVACPVFGATPMAHAGQLICVLAGPREAVEKVKPYCKGVMGRAEIDFSDQKPGQATLMKIVGNTFILSMVEALSEGHVLAEKSGLGVESLHSFIELMFPGPYTAYSNRLRSGDYYQQDPPLFAVDLARKDARHAMGIAEKAGTSMKNVQIADGLLQVVKEHKGSTGDLAGMYGAKRMEAGLKYENQE